LKNIEEWQEKNDENRTNYKKKIQERLASSDSDGVIDITDIIVSDLRNGLFSGFCSAFQKSLINSFSSLKNLNNAFTNKNFEVKILDEHKKNSLVFYLNEKENINAQYIEDYSGTIGVKKGFIYLNGFQSMDCESYMFACRLAPRSILTSLSDSFRDIYYLPASRSGLYQGLNSFSPIIAELSQHRHLLKNSTIELPTLPEPLADFFKDISTVNKNYINAAFSEVIENIEQKILQGKIDYNEETRKITFQPNNTKLELNLSQASSMVAEIAPMIIYFKHIIGSKNRQFDENEKIGISDIIFIEEPEAHLHPEVQVALMEIFVALSKLGLKIFITSHSNYMFNKLNNLIIDNQIVRDKAAVYHLVKGANGSTQNMNMLVTADGIEDDNFQATSEKLYEERMRIYDNAHD
jgi:predicted ATPase